MSARTALVTGITGQDGAWLARLLLAKDYRVHGLRRPSSTPNTARVEALRDDPRFAMHFGDLTDAGALVRLVERTAPHEIYNLAAQSHVQIGFEMPEYTANADALGALRLLEAIRTLRLERRVRFYQASSSELFGVAAEAPQSEDTPFLPVSPYGAAKLFAHRITVIYREAWGMHASNGILFNHESPVRGEAFVSRKISRGVAAIEHGLQDCLRLGNLDACRDWGHARDYVEGMWLMLQQPAGDDYVLATGEAHSVREFAARAFAEVGRTVQWRGTGEDETGVDAATGQVLVRVDPRHFRPADVDRLVGDPGKARRVLGWRHRTGFATLVKEMVAEDVRALSGDGRGVGAGRFV